MTQRRLTAVKVPERQLIDWKASIARMEVGDRLPVKHRTQASIGGQLARFNTEGRRFVSKKKDDETVLIIRVE